MAPAQSKLSPSNSPAKKKAKENTPPTEEKSPESHSGCTCGYCGEPDDDYYPRERGVVYWEPPFVVWRPPLTPMKFDPAVELSKVGPNGKYVTDDGEVVLEELKKSPEEFKAKIGEFLTEQDDEEFIQYCDKVVTNTSPHVKAKLDCCKECWNDPCFMNAYYKEFVEHCDYSLDTFKTAKQCRFEMYRYMSQLLHGRMGKGNRRPLPSCVEIAIKDQFVALDGKYTGFKSGKNDDVEKEF